MSEEILKSIDSKLTSIIKLLAIDAIKDKPKGEQAEFLHKIGLSSTQIGDILNKSPTTVRVQLHQKKQGKKVKNNG